MSPLGKVTDNLRRAVLWHDGAGLTDGQLLGCFLEDRDEAAFAALVRRHGPMVWGVCRRVLASHHDAEDAFQATFLVLARKAASVLPREKVGNWLYGVAHQTALKARETAARRKGREKQVSALPEPVARDPHLRNDLQSLLDQELSRLPEKYRVPLVLCDLGGKTRKEAARQLDCPEGTLAARLARARVMLARRLAAHGLAVAAETLALVLSEEAASASAPAELVTSTIKVATLAVAGRVTCASANVLVLAEGVLKAMLISKLKSATVALLVLGFVAAGAGAFCRTQVGEGVRGIEKGEKQAPPKHGAATDPEKKASKGPGGLSEEQRKRLLRWRISFRTQDGGDYARQLEALGAILAVPGEKEKEFRVVRDLAKRPVTPVAEDLARIDHIYWMEDNAKSLRSLAKTLGLEPTPKYLVVFLPRYVEDELQRKELAFKGLKADDILETGFEFSRTEKGFDIKVAYQRAKD